jgi:chorismate mutase/prephenate dehydratase
VSLTDFRVRITAADRELLAAMNRRLELVRELHDFKQAEGIPLRDPEREQQLVVELQAANKGPLSDQGVADLFRHVLDLTRREIHGE